MVADEQFFRTHFAIDARTNCEAITFRQGRTVDLRDVATGRVTTEPYDKLVLSPGASSVRPPLPASTCPGSSRSGRCPTRGRSANGSKEGRHSSSGMSNYSGIQIMGPKRRASWLGAASSASRPRRTWYMPGSTSRCSNARPRARSAGPGNGTVVEEHVAQHGVRLALGDGVAGFEPWSDGRSRSGRRAEEKSQPTS